MLAQTLRTSLAGATDVDLSGITSIGLVARSDQGNVWLLDVAGRRPGLALPSDPAVPILRVLDVHEPEGSAADPQQVDVTVAVRGEITATTPVAVRAVSPDGQSLRRTTIIFELGQSSATFSIPIERDDLDDFPSIFGFDAFAYATNGSVVAGDYGARVFVRDDDPAPDVAVDRAARTVPEGSMVKWQIGLAEPVDYFAELRWSIVKPQGGAPSLRTNDVPVTWLRSVGVRPPERPVALWRVKGLGGSVFLEPGQISASTGIPTIADHRRELREVVALRVRGGDFGAKDSQESVAGVSDRR